MYWAGAPSAVAEGSVLEESWLGWGSSGWESLMEGWLQSDLRQLGGGGGSPAALPAQRRSAHAVLPGPRSRCVCGLEQAGEGVGRAWGDMLSRFTRLHSAARGRESGRVWRDRPIVPWGLSTVDLVLGPRGLPL